jgi:uncharacterized lipoprotein YajG
MYVYVMRNIERMITTTSQRGKMSVNVVATSPIFSGAYHAENATIAGICSRQTCSAYAEPISMLDASNSN